MSEEEGGNQVYTIFGLTGTYNQLNLKGKDNIFYYPYCENDRLWRRMLYLTPERYRRNADYEFDECDNAYVKPKPPVKLDLIENLHKKSDY